jgi:ankyrin repeat protein
LETILRNYEHFKKCLVMKEGCSSDSDIGIRELQLFVDHFLRDRDIFESFGLENLHGLGHLSFSHWQAMQQWSISRDIDDLEKGVLALDDEPKTNDAQGENLSTPIQDAENHTPASISPQLNSTASVRLISSGFKDGGQWMLTASRGGGLSSNESAIRRKRRRLWGPESDGDFMPIQAVLPHGITVNSTEAKAGADLLAAARDGRMDLATILLDQGANVNFTAPSGNTPVSMAARNGHYEVTRLLLQRGANVDGSGRDRGVPLIAAAKMGHSEIAMLLLDHGATLKSDTAVARSLLVSAAKYGDTDLVQNLLQRDININCAVPERDSTNRGLHSFMLKSAEYRSPLAAAIEGGHLKTVQLLLERGAKPNDHERDSHSPLAIAIKDGHNETALQLLEHKANPNVFRPMGCTLLRAAVERGNCELVRRLLQYGADPNQESAPGILRSPLSVATKEGNIEIVQLLLDCGANPNGHERDSNSPLVIAIKGGRNEIAFKLLEHGADPNRESLNTTDEWDLYLLRRTENLQSPLSVATKGGNIEIVRLLLDCGVNPNGHERDSNSPLVIAIKGGHNKIALQLLERKANPNGHERDSNSPLVIAIKGGHNEVALQLLERKANPNGHERDPDSPLAIAIKGGHNEIVLQLLERKANPNAIGLEIGSPLKAAVRRGNHELVRYLLQCGADPNQGSPNDTTGEWGLYPLWGTEDLRSPLSVATKRGDTEIVQLLLEYGANPNGHDGNPSFPLAIAESAGHSAIKEVLLRYGASLDDSIVIAIKQKESKRAYQRLHELFLKEHLRFFASSRENSASSSFLAIGNKLQDHRKMWKRGIHTLRQILSNDTPQTLEEAVSFLHIVSAMRLLIHGDEMIGSKDEFLEDLDRWKVIVADEERSLYDEIMFAMWGKEPNSPLAGDSVYTIETQLEYFRRLASSLIAQTGITRLSGAPSGHGLYRLRAVHSSYESLQNPPPSYPKHQRADQSTIGEEPPLLVQDDHRFIEMHGGEQILAEPTSPPSHLVVFLMAGAIFGIVITFLLSEQVLDFLLYYTNLNLVSRNFSRNSSLRRSIRHQQTKILNHIIDSVVLPLRNCTYPGTLHQVCVRIIGALKQGRINTCRELAMALREGAQVG